MAVGPVWNNLPNEPEPEPSPNASPVGDPTTGPQPGATWSGPPGLPVSRQGRDVTPGVHVESIKRTLKTVTDFCDIQALSVDGFPLSYSIDRLARELISANVKQVVIAGAFADSPARPVAEGWICIMGRQLQRLGKQITYCAPAKVVNRIALRNVSEEETVNSVYYAFNIKRTPDGPSVDSEVLARLKDRLSPSDLFISIESKW